MGSGDTWCADRDRRRNSTTEPVPRKLDIVPIYLRGTQARKVSLPRQGWSLRVATDPRVLLAERVEALVSQEHAKWASSREAKEKDKAPDVAGRER
jgi:hypothetical protein